MSASNSISISSRDALSSCSGLAAAAAHAAVAQRAICHGAVARWRAVLLEVLRPLRNSWHNSAVSSWNQAGWHLCLCAMAADDGAAGGLPAVPHSCSCCGYLDVRCMSAAQLVAQQLRWRRTMLQHQLLDVLADAALEALPGAAGCTLSFFSFLCWPCLQLARHRSCQHALPESVAPCVYCGSKRVACKVWRRQQAAGPCAAGPGYVHKFRSCNGSAASHACGTCLPRVRSVSLFLPAGAEVHSFLGWKLLAGWGVLGW